jgi:hypothetical protein
VLTSWVNSSVYDDLNLAHDGNDETSPQLLSDFTFVPEDSGLSLYFGSQTADLVLYTEMHDLEKVIEADDLLSTAHRLSSDDIKVPLAVIELKRGNGDSDAPSTDTIRARSPVAQDMKRVFPFTGYFLFIDQSTVGKQKLYRAGRDFDAAFITPEMATPDYIHESIIEHAIKPHLDRLDYLGIL